MKRPQVLLGSAVLILGILSAGPAIRATESEDVVTNGNVAGEPFEGARLSLPFQTHKNFSLAAVTESSAEADEADKLAKELANQSLRSSACPFKQTRIGATALPATATSSLL